MIPQEVKDKIDKTKEEYDKKQFYNVWDLQRDLAIIYAEAIRDGLITNCNDVWWKGEISTNYDAVVAMLAIIQNKERREQLLRAIVDSWKQGTPGQYKSDVISFLDNIQVKLKQFENNVGVNPNVKKTSTSKKTKRLNFSISSLLNRQSVEDKSKNLEWTLAFQKWYGEHQSDFEEFVEYLVLEKGYIKADQHQINAFIRTITGKDVPRAAERVFLVNDDKKARYATRAMLYLKYKGLVKGTNTKLLDIFDPEAPREFWASPTSHAKIADKEYQNKVNEIFAEILSKPRQKVK